MNKLKNENPDSLYREQLPQPDGSWFPAVISTKILRCFCRYRTCYKINPKAVKVMKEAGIDISHHYPKNVDNYINEEWDYVITVCDDANETCPFSRESETSFAYGF